MGVEACPKCGARVIDEEMDRHKCDIPLRVSDDSLILRDRKGFWRRYPLSETVRCKLDPIPPELVASPFCITPNEAPLAVTPQTKQNRTREGKA